MNHTKEPWHVEGYGQMNRITDGKETVGYIDPIIRARPKIDDIAEGEANARRIVACVNACADVEDEKLSLGYVKRLEEENERLNNLVMMQNYTIEKLSEQHNDVITGTEIPVVEDRRDTGTSTPITHCPYCGRKLEDV